MPRTSNLPAPARSRPVYRAMITLALAAIVTVLASSAATAVPRTASHGVLNRAFNALGGVDALAATSTLQIEANGEARVGFEGSDPSDVVTADTYIRSNSIDLDQDLIRVDVSRQPLFEAFQFFPGENFTIVANQDIGHLSNQALTYRLWPSSDVNPITSS